MSVLMIDEVSGQVIVDWSTVEAIAQARSDAESGDMTRSDRSSSASGLADALAQKAAA